MSRPLRRSYFDLLKEKYPEPDELKAVPGRADAPASEVPAPAAAMDRGGGPAVASRRGRRLLALLLGLLAASLSILFLGPLKRPGADRPASQVPPRTAMVRAAEPRAAAPEAVEPRVAGQRAAVAEAAVAETGELQALARAVESPTPAPRAAAVEAAARDAELRAAEPTVAERWTAGEPIAEASELAGPPATTSRPDPRPIRSAESRPAAPEPALPAAEPGPAIGVKVFAPQPEYPAAARQAGLEGSVLVEAEVDASGRVSDAQVVEGSSPELDRAAVEAILEWRFAPARRDGKPLAYRYRQEFRFALEPADRSVSEAPSLPRTVDVAPPPNGDEATPPVKLATPLPGYTAAAWAAGVEGDVELRATIDERGEVAGVEVVRGLPHGLTEAAVAAVRQWKFRPATRGGEPVAVVHRLSLRFAL